jgi:hypothetical protein
MLGGPMLKIALANLSLDHRQSKPLREAKEPAASINAIIGTVATSRSEHLFCPLICQPLCSPTNDSS